jgi:hypothetical protein
MRCAGQTACSTCPPYTSGSSGWNASASRLNSWNPGSASCWLCSAWLGTSTAMTYLAMSSRRSVPNAARKIRALMKGAPRLVLAPARQLPLGEQPLVLRGLLGPDVDDDDVQLTHDRGSLDWPCADLGGRCRLGQSMPDSTLPSARTRDPPFGADFGSLPITRLAVWIWALCASMSRAGRGSLATRWGLRTGQVSRGSPGGVWIGTGCAAWTSPWTRSGGSAPG